MSTASSPPPSALAAALADRYTIERELGTGGMATVYLAQDLKHDRKVALKVLKPELAAVLGAERFVVEIKTTASLSHPHILPLFDSGTASGFLYYVMPFIEGETLRDRLNRETQLGVDEALRMAAEVADALDYAHRHGVIHRDIKPENILLHDGRPMVADFGIALAVSAAAGGRMTETGLSLGTPHYMSPEQATAEKDISARSDIYSLASVLFEMLAGQPPHLGGSAQQIIMKIITEVAPDVRTLRKSVPAHAAAALAQALEKLPADRFATAREFAAALADRQFTSATTSATSDVVSRGWRAWVRDPRSLALAAVSIVAVGITLFLPRRGDAPAGTASMRFTVLGPEDSLFVSMSTRGSGSLSGPVVSPDGRFVAFAASRANGSTMYLRAMDSFEVTEIPVQDAHSPFFSPDGRSLGFLKESEVWRLDVEDAKPTRVGELPGSAWDLMFAAWHPDGRLLVTSASTVWAVPATGGKPMQLFVADTDGQASLAAAQPLEDGSILVAVNDGAGGHSVVMDADGSGRRRVLEGRGVVQVFDDIAIYAEGAQRYASFFHRRRLALTGTPIALPDARSNRPGRSIAWVPNEGTTNLEPVWVSPGGKVESVGLRTGNYRWPRLSLDGGRLAVENTRGLQVYDFRRGVWTRLQGSTEPVWSHDGRFVFQSAGNAPAAGLLRQVSDGSRAPDTLMKMRTGDAWPTDVSPDDAWLAYYGAATASDSASRTPDASDLYFMELPTKRIRRLAAPGFQRGARFSPDGRWVAYESNEGGRSEIFVRPWPSLDAVYQVSQEGGTEPAWSADGRQLYYRRRSEVVAVAVSAQSDAFVTASPRVLFAGAYRHDTYGDQSYDLARDGRFLMLRPVLGGRASVQVELNWLASVRVRLERAQ